jgi:hypothetical protein
MGIKKNIMEDNNDFDWIVDIKPNPFELYPFVVVFIDNKNVTEEEIGYLIDLLKSADVTASDWDLASESLLKYGKENLGAYLKVYVNQYGFKKISYGDHRLRHEEYAWDNVDEYLASKNNFEYKEYKLKDIVKPNDLNESDDFDWMRGDIETPLNQFYYLGYGGEDIIGFKVRISKSSRFYDPDDEGNPIDEVGVINDYSDGDTNLPIEVLWPSYYGSFTNTYNWNDLIVVNRGNKLNESDDFDWIRDVVPISDGDDMYTQATMGDSFKIRVKEPYLRKDCSDQYLIYGVAKKGTNITFVEARNGIDIYDGSCNSATTNRGLLLKFNDYRGHGHDGGLPDRSFIENDKISHLCNESCWWVHPQVIEVINDNINESTDDFDWIRDTEPDPSVPYVGMRFKITQDQDTKVIYTINGITDTHMVINWVDPDSEGYMDDFKWPLNSYFGFVDKGDVEIVYENLNESDDLDWIRSSKPTLHDKVITFEPMIDIEEYRVVKDQIKQHNNWGDNVSWWRTGSLDGGPMFETDQLIHHLIIGLDGKMVYGGIDSYEIDVLFEDGWSDEEIRNAYDDKYVDIDTFIESNENHFYNPETIDGRKYFNIPYTKPITESEDFDFLKDDEDKPLIIRGGIIDTERSTFSKSEILKRIHESGYEWAYGDDIFDVTGKLIFEPSRYIFLGPIGHPVNLKENRILHDDDLDYIKKNNLLDLLYKT